ncbi:nuclear receptor subfamily 5 group A member 2-like protein [Lates japonicus]|uniref:Nuclear receptor subfamily 5 group A member 2-like protein n=1 Tax=Lates japonicus TaxID=270547 RepID=A0AAD3ND36_LATJO|nr:nuclear receptor subfamily 5 group A member 2-like protein [Lates japonicus]
MHRNQNSDTMIYLSGLVGFLLVLTTEARVGNSSELKFCSETEQCLLFNLICKTEEYEVRHYDSVKWVSTNETSFFMEFAAMKAFRRLYEYITGANDKDMKMFVRSYGGWMTSTSDKNEASSLSTALDLVDAKYKKGFHYAVGYNRSASQERFYDTHQRSKSTCRPQTTISPPGLLGLPVGLSLACLRCPSGLLCDNEAQELKSEPCGRPESEESCPICGDKVSGYHYGLLTCESCKGFFKRSVQNNKQYTCAEQQSCPMNLSQRKRCPSCRFQKCLVVGMKREANSWRGEQDESQLCAKVLASLQREQANRGKHDRLNTFSIMCKMADQTLFGLVEWARNTTLFKELKVEDQMVLLQSCWSELLVLDHLCRQVTYGKDGCIYLVTGQQIEVSTIISQAGVTLSSLVSRTQDLVSKLKALQLDRHEFVCLKYLVLFNPDVKSVQSRRQVEQTQERVNRALMEHTQRSHPGYSDKFGQLLLRLPEVRSISLQVEDYLYQRHLLGDLPCNSLLTEMLHTKHN